jgi:hypothetical protein
MARKFFSKVASAIYFFVAKSFGRSIFFGAENFEREIFLAKIFLARKILARKNVGNLPDFKT